MPIMMTRSPYFQWRRKRYGRYGGTIPIC